MNAKRIKEFDNIVTAFTKGEVAGKKIGDQGYRTQEGILQGRRDVEELLEHAD